MSPEEQVFKSILALDPLGLEDERIATQSH